MERNREGQRRRRRRTRTNLSSSTPPRRQRREEEEKQRDSMSVMSSKRRKTKTEERDDDGDSTQEEEESVLVEEDEDNDKPLLMSVSVPRKARSCSRQTAFGSLTASIDVERKKQGEGGVESGFQEVEKSYSGSGLDMVQEDTEIEAAEVLFGLMKHLHNVEAEKVQVRDLDLVLDQNDVNGAEVDSTRVQSSSIAVVEEAMGLQSSTAEELSITVVANEGSRVVKNGISMVTDKEHNGISKMNANLQDSTVTKASASTFTEDEKFVIDLMAPPPLESSPEQDSSCNLSLDLFTDCTRKETKKIGEEPEAKLDSDKPIHDGMNGDESNTHQIQLPKVIVPKIEATAQSSQVTLPSGAIAGCSTDLPPLGHTSPFQAVMQMDANTPLQYPPFVLSKYRPNRCATHRYIATSICLHKQHMYHLWPPPTGSAASVGNIIVGNPFPVVNLTASHSKGPSAMKFPVSNGNGKIPITIHSVDPVHKLQATVQQSPSPASAGNLSNGPAFYFPFGQHPALIAPAASQTGSSVSATTVSVSGNTLTGVTTDTKPLSAAAPTLSYTYQNNACPLATSATVRNLPATKSSTPSQALPFYSGSFYSSQILQSSRLQQNASASLVNGSSSSCKQPQNPWACGPQMPQQIKEQHESSHRAQKLRGNSSDKKENQRCRDKNLNGGVDVITTQVFAVSFSSSNGKNTPSNLNFSSMTARNPPEMIRPGYQTVSATQVAVQTGHENKSSVDGARKAALGMSPANTGKTIVFDNSVRTLNFTSPSFPGNWPSRSMSPSTRAQQVTQLQHQQQPHPATAGRSRAATPNNLRIVPGGAKFARSASIFSQPTVLINSSKTPNSQGPLINFSQQQGRTLLNHNQISFGGD